MLQLFYDNYANDAKFFKQFPGIFKGVENLFSEFDDIISNDNVTETVNDDNYLAALENNDEKTMRAIIDAAAAEHGFTVFGYHGDKKTGLTEIRKNGLVWITSSKKYADSYAERLDGDGYGDTLPLYGKPGNALEVGEININIRENGKFTKAFTDIAQKLKISPYELDRFAPGSEGKVARRKP